MIKVVEPIAELWLQDKQVNHVARCARVCYQSESSGKEADARLYKNLINQGHLSMLRHATSYFHVPAKDADQFMMMQMPTSEYCGTKVTDNLDILIVANGQYVFEHPELTAVFEEYERTPQYFLNLPDGMDMMRYTFCLTTQISTSRELNRKSPNNIAEMSTRYIKFGGKVEPSIVRPHWIGEDEARLWNKEYMFGLENNTKVYLASCDAAFQDYEILIENGMQPQDARGVLPLDTLTKVVMTYSVKEWKQIIRQRYHGTTGKPHGNCVEIIGQVRDKLIELGYAL